MYRPTERITVVTRPTRLEGVLRRWATRGQAMYFFKANQAVKARQAGNMEQAVAAQKNDNVDFELLEDEDATYQQSVKDLVRDLDLGVPVQTIDRSLMPNYDFSFSAAVVVLGQDGLVANTAKYVGNVPILGVNPDPARFDGVLLPFQVKQARDALRNHLAGKSTIRKVTLAEVKLQDGQRLLAFNDLFIGVRSHVSARYRLRVDGQEELQSSSGVLVSTGAGSTGWMSSVYNMAAAVAGTRDAKGNPKGRPQMAWEDPRLLWVVREPFVSRTSQAGLVCGTLDTGKHLEIESMSPENGVIFSDGIEADNLEFNAGTLATIGVAQQQAHLIVPKSLQTFLP
ncbi:NAD(+)/NADH kinase [soil metagenome]